VTSGHLNDFEGFVSVAKRREREREARRNEILDAAQRVFYARSYDLATMDDIADEAQLGKGTLYIYFRTKQDMLVGVAMRFQQSVLDACEHEHELASDGLDLVKRLLNAYASRMSDNQEHLKMVVSRWAAATPLADDSASGDKMRENIVRVFSFMRGAVERGQRDGSIRANVDPVAACMTLWAAVNGQLLLRLQMCCMPAPLPFGQLAPTLDQSIELLLDSVRARPLPRASRDEMTDKALEAEAS
jgi:TetR/AcrR family transcriptional regulator